MPDTHDTIDERVEKAVKAAGMTEVLVCYSAYDMDEDDEPIDNLNEVAVEGRVRLVGFNDEFWGEGKDYQSEILENPTWLQVTVCANKMIEVTGDQHHAFLEGLSKLHKGKQVEEGVTLYELSMGS